MVNSNVPTKAREIPQEFHLLREPCIRSPRSDPPPGKPYPPIPARCPILRAHCENMLTYSSFYSLMLH